MRLGFPSHMSIAEPLNMFKSNSEFEVYTHTNKKQFCTILLRACYLKWTDFKLGNTQIFFRKNKIDFFSEKLKEDPIKIKERIDQLILLRKKLKVAIMFARFYAIICKGRRKESNDCVNEIQSEEHVIIPRKKMRLNKNSSQSRPSSGPSFMQTDGNEEKYFFCNIFKI